MSEIENIYFKHLDINVQNYSDKIKYYESNIITLDSKKNFKDPEEFEQYILILADYVLALEREGYYTKAIKYADKFLLMVENRHKEFGVKLNENDFYRGVLAHKARSLFELKDYKKSKIYFERVLEIDPENDGIKNWIADCKRGSKIKKARLFYILGFIFVILDLTIGRNSGIIPDSYLLAIIGFSFLMIAVYNEYIS
jgi:tetratricopeptide (TPR) repeat protein